MFRKNGVVCLVLLLGLGGSACEQKKESKPGAIRNFPMSRKISIPVQLFSGDTASAALRENPGALSITAGDTDELPQGPESFEILNGGSFVITDPLQQRLVFYDSLGAYLETWPLGFPANSVILTESGALEVRHAITEEIYMIDDSRQPRPVPAAARGRRSATTPNEGQLSRGQNRGQIAISETRSGGPGALDVSFESDSTTMISLESLGTDDRGFTYVALETTPSGDAAQPIVVNKIIRKYAADGALAGQISDIAIDYYVAPNDEFRVRRGFVYQLAPLQDKVEIRVWDTK